jgi:tRNA(Arg) A34 adenosine deaminase TadA
MHSQHLALLEQAPPSRCSADVWARLCCEQALLALEDGCHAVGAVLVTQAGELLLSGRNRVFSQHYGSARHAEMMVIDQLEALHPEQDRNALTLYVSLQPCLMCYARILLSGIPRVRYLARDRNGGFDARHAGLPPIWANLASRVSLDQAEVDPYWCHLAGQAVDQLQDPAALRSRILRAWTGDGAPAAQAPD